MRGLCVKCKLRQLGTKNQIVDQSKSNDHKIGCRLMANLEPDDKIGLQLKHDFDQATISIKIRLFLIKMVD